MNKIFIAFFSLLYLPFSFSEVDPFQDLNEKTHNFSSMCHLLTSKKKDMQIMHPTAGGGLEFSNDLTAGTGSSDLTYKGVNFSERFCDRFRLHNAPIVRNREKIVQLHPHLFEVVNYAIEYVRNIEQFASTEALGELNAAVTAGDNQFSMTLNQQMWPDPVDGSYVFQNIEFAIRDSDFFEICEVDGRVLAHTVTLNVAGGVFSAVVETNVDLPQISNGTRAIFEHPPIKAMFSTIHDVLCPEVECELADYNRRVDLTRENMYKLLNGMDFDDFDRLPFIICEKKSDEAERLGGYSSEVNEDGTYVINSRRAHIYRKHLSATDRFGDTVDIDSEDAVSFDLNWDSVFIVSNEQTTREVGDISMTGGTAQIRFAGHPPSRPEYFKPFEQAYILNYGRVVDDNTDPFDDTDDFSFQWAGVDSNFDLAGRSRFSHLLNQSTEFFHFVGADGEGHLDVDWTKHIGERVLKEFNDKLGSFPGADPIEFGDFSATTSTSRTVEVDAKLAEHVTNGVFNKIFEFVTNVESVFYQDNGRGARTAGHAGILIRCALTDIQKSAFVQHMGQKLELKTTDGTNIQVPATNLGIFENTLILHVLSNVDNFATWSSGFTTNGNLKDFKVTLGVEGNFEDDLYHTIRTQGLDQTEEFSVVHSRDIRLYPGDYIRSLAQADDQMLYSRLAITSQDLLVQPVISQGFRSLLLHSFPLPHDYTAQVDRNFNVTGMGSGIPGTLSWRDRGGEAIVHPIQMGSASLRHFSISAALKPRDSSSISSKQIMLPRGGIFEVTLIFLKDFSAK